MVTRATKLDKQFDAVLDTLKTGRDRFLGGDLNLAAGARSTVGEIEPAIVRSTKDRWPFRWMYRVNLDKLDGKLRAKFGDLAERYRVGFCYLMKREGKIVHFNAARFAQLRDDGDVPWGLHVPMSVGSVSKLITAIAVLRLLRDTGHDSATSVYDFLPAYWRPHYTLKKVTFRDLLRHESGLGRALNPTGSPPAARIPGPGDFLAAKTYVFAGTPGPGTAFYDYKNLNYAVLRVAFAVLSGLDRNLSFVQLGISDDSFWDLASALAYTNVVNDTLFAVSDILPREFARPADAAKAYATPPKRPGIEPFGGLTQAGPGGWHLSVGELVRLLDQFTAEAIVPHSLVQELLSNLYGLDQAISTQAGPVYYKGGREGDGKKAVDAAIYMMPGDISFAIFVNSIGRAPAVSAVPGGTAPEAKSHLDDVSQMIVDSVEFGF